MIVMTYNYTFKVTSDNPHRILPYMNTFTGDEWRIIAISQIFQQQYPDTVRFKVIGRFVVVENSKEGFCLVRDASNASGDSVQLNRLLPHDMTEERLAKLLVMV